MAVPIIVTSTPTWVKVVSANFAVLTVETPGDAILYINSIADDITAVELSSADTDTSIHQDEAKDVWIKSEGTKAWRLRLETAG